MKQASSTSLPIKGNFPLYLKLTWVIAALIFISSLANLISSNIIYPTAQLMHSFLANDFVNILVGIPVVVIPLWMVRSGKTLGLLLWPGALLFILYNYLIYLLTLPFSFNYFLILLIFLISLIVFWFLLRSMDGERIKTYIGITKYNQWISALLIFFGLAFLLRAGMLLVNHILGHAPLPMTEIALNISDSFFSLIWITCGVAFFASKPLGYKTVLGLMYQLSMLFVGLIAVMVIQPVIMQEPIAIISLIILVGMSLIVIIPFLLFILAIQQRRKIE